MNNKRILLLSYCISPFRGSEFSVGWNYITQMSEDNEIIVLYGTSNGEFNNTTEMEDYIKQHELKNVKFVPVKIKVNYLNKILLFILKNKLEFQIPYYFLYRGWHKQAYKKAKEIISNKKIDIIHYLNPIGFKEPGYVWKLDKPYIWGPITGVHTYPKQLMTGLTFKDKLLHKEREILHPLALKYNVRVKKAINRTDVLFVATSETQNQILELFNKESVFLPENGIVKMEHKIPIKKTEKELTRLIWIGGIEYRKNLILLLDALSLLKTKNSNWILNIVGDGCLAEKMKDKTMKNRINDNIIWHGKIPRDEVQKILFSSHLNIITSLGEGNPTVIWEAMSKGIPTMTLDHCGMHDTICENCGIKIPIMSYKETTIKIANEIEKIILNPEIINQLSIGTLECAKQFLWENRKKILNQQIEFAINKKD